MKAHLHTAIGIAVHVLAGRPGYRRGLAATDRRFGVLEGRSMHCAPGGCSEPVAIALEPIGINDRLLQHLRLVTLMTHRGQQP